MHRRWRWFLLGWLPVANADSTQQQRAGITIGVEAQRLDTDHGSTITEDVANTMRIRPQRQGQLVHTSHQAAQRKRKADQLEHVRKRDQWAVEPSMGRVVDGLSTRVARYHNRAALKALGNAVVPQCAYVVGRRLNQIIEEGR
jgi:site-specific DNA-cytosine methylase